MLIPEDCLLINFLLKKYKDSSKSSILSWIKNSCISVDGKIIKVPTTPLKKGQKISKHTAKPLPYNLKIIFEDNHFLIVDKPTNLLSVPKDIPGFTNVLTILRNHFKTQNIFAVHRIDRETSGLLLYAKSFFAMQKFKEIFKKHDIIRKYFAIVEGKSKPSGKFENFLIEKRDLKMHISTKGEKAITFYKTLHRTKSFSFLSLTLQTGKKHQIRVQCKNANHPIVGDKKYNCLKNPINRMCLHAYLLEFIHPFTKKKMSFLSPLPEEFNKLGAEKILKNLYGC